MPQGNILLVDDEPDIVKQFKRALVGEGYSVETATNGKEGWESYQNRYYDVAIVDWKMEKMNGMELLKKIDEMHPTTKVIMITAFGDEQTVIEATNNHAFAYLKKPVDLNILLKKIEEALQRKDLVIEAFEDWVIRHPEQATTPLKGTLSGEVWSAKDILEEIKGNTEQGRAEYRKLLQLTIDLLTRGKIK